MSFPTSLGVSNGPFETSKRKPWGEEAKLLAKYRDFVDFGEEEASVFPTHTVYALKKQTWFINIENRAP